MSLRSPLGRVLGHGSAKEGVHHWWIQRLTAIALVPLSAWFIVSLLALPTLEYVTVVEWLAQGWTALLMVLLVLVLARHSHLGVQVVVEDYVHDRGLKTVALVLSSFVHAAAAAAATFAVLKVAFGGAA